MSNTLPSANTVFEGLALQDAISEVQKARGEKLATLQDATAGLALLLTAGKDTEPHDPRLVKLHRFFVDPPDRSAEITEFAEYKKRARRCSWSI